MLLVIYLIISYILQEVLKFYFFINLEPMFLVSFLIIYLIFYHKNDKSFYFILISSIIYDLFLGNVLFLYTLIFIILYYVIYFLCSKFNKYFLIDFLILIY